MKNENETNTTAPYVGQSCYYHSIPARFTKHGMFHFCGNRCLRRFERSHKLEKTQNRLSPDSKRLYSFSTRPLEGRNIDTGLFRLDTRGKMMPLPLLKDKVGKIIAGQA